MICRGVWLAWALSLLLGTPRRLLPPAQRSQVPQGSWLQLLLTQGNVPGVFPLYVPEKIPLSRVQGPPFFLGEIEGNVSKCHRSLK